MEVHKFVLCSSSTVLRQNKVCNICQCFTKNVKYQELELIIEFLYKGEVQVPENRLSKFIDAEDLEIKGFLDLDGGSCEIDNIKESYVKTDESSNQNADTDNQVHSLIVINKVHQNSSSNSIILKANVNQIEIEDWCPKTDSLTAKLKPKCKECGKEFKHSKDWMFNMKRHLFKVHNSVLFDGAEKP